MGRHVIRPMKAYFVEAIDNVASLLQGMPVLAFEEGLRLGRLQGVFIDRQAG